MNSSVVNTKIYKQILHLVKNPSGGYAGYRFINQAGDATDAIKYGANKISLTAKEVASRAGSNTGRPPMTVSMDSISDSIKRVRDYERAMKAAQKAKTNPIEAVSNTVADTVRQVTSQAPKTQYQNRQNQGSVIKSQDIINANNRELLKQRFVQNMTFRLNQEFNR